MGGLFPAFRETREVQSVLLTLATSQVILILNNRYTNVLYLGTACPEPYQILLSNQKE